MTIDEIAAYFQPLKTHNPGYIGHCPICGRDEHVYINPGKKAGSTVLYCQGCSATAKDLLPAVGLEIKDLFENEPKVAGRKHEYKSEDGTTYAYKKISPKADVPGKKIAYWYYYDANGKFVKGQPKGVPTPLYHAWELVMEKACAEKNHIPLIVCEGEKDVETTEQLSDFLGSVTSLPNGASQKKWTANFTPHFIGRDVFVLMDNDEAGEGYGQFVERNVRAVAKSVHLVRMKDLYPAEKLKPKDDISDVLGYLEVELGTLSQAQVELGKRLTDVFAEMLKADENVSGQRSVEDEGEDEDGETAADVAKKRLPPETLPTSEQPSAEGAEGLVVNTVPPAKGPEQPVPAEKGEKRKAKAAFTVEVMEEYLALKKRAVRFNQITKRIDFEGVNRKCKKIKDLESFVTYTFSDFKASDDYTGITMEHIQSYLRTIALENAYNPVVEYITKEKWDGIDRWEKLFSLMELSKDELSKKLLKKWFWQAIVLLENDVDDVHEPEGVLVFQGGQGIGKTMFCRWIALKQEWFQESESYDPRDKDTTISITGAWIAELGEIGSTMKRDIDAVKAFLNRAIDSYRVPYGRSEIKHPRRTSIAATCNDKQFLSDPTGNRRYFTIHVTKMPTVAEQKKFDILQLWRQAYAEVRERGKDCYFLDAEEKSELAKRNAAATKPLPAEDEVLDVLAEAEEGHWKPSLMTASQFKEQNPVLRKYDARKIGAVLAKLGYDQKKTKTGRYYELFERPYQLDNSHRGSDGQVNVAKKDSDSTASDESQGDSEQRKLDFDSIIH